MLRIRRRTYTSSPSGLSRSAGSLDGHRDHLSRRRALVAHVGDPCVHAALAPRVYALLRLGQVGVVGELPACADLPAEPPPARRQQALLGQPAQRPPHRVAADLVLPGEILLARERLARLVLAAGDRAPQAIRHVFPERLVGNRTHLRLLDLYVPIVLPLLTVD